jgi:hypothetical protein
MTYEITIYTKFGIKCYDMEGESDNAMLSFFRGKVDHRQYRERVTIYNKETNHVEFIQNF